MQVLRTTTFAIFALLGVPGVGSLGCSSSPVCPKPQIAPSESPSHQSRVSASTKRLGDAATPASEQTRTEATNASDELRGGQVERERVERDVAFPVTRRRNYRIETAERLAIEVDPTDGARIIEFSLEGRNALVTIAESPDAHGSSIWPSPQSDWIWPPPPELDRLSWQVVETRRALVLESSISSALGLKVIQRIAPEERSKSVRIDYEFVNVGTKPRKLAPWQNSRVRPNGTTFYPATRGSYGYQDNTLALVPERGVTWFHHRPEDSKESRKSYADGREGWVAHLDGRLLFVKQFVDVPVERQAPKEGEVVLYVDGRGRFVEVEQQGSYDEIPAGSSRTWTVRWYLRWVPESMTNSSRDTLVSFVREQLVSLP
ncbi:MAG: DUF4380 domain-containing protein [Polyangiaceae bacterium]